MNIRDWLVSFRLFISTTFSDVVRNSKQIFLELIKRRSKVQEKNMSCKRTLTIVTRNSLETRAELAALSTYVENQAMLEPILLYRASKCKQTKE